MQIITVNKNETCIITFEVFLPSETFGKPTPINLSGYNFALTLTATENQLINNSAENVEWKNTTSPATLKVQIKEGKINVNFPMKALKNNFYIGRLYMFNNDWSLLLSEFQLVSQNVRL